MSRIVCWSISSGSSVCSMIPPNSARIERFILVHSPISYLSSSEFRFEDHGVRAAAVMKRERAFVCTKPKGAQLQVTADFGRSIAKNGGWWAVAGLTGRYHRAACSLTDVV